VILSDMRMPYMDGMTFLSRAREVAPDAVQLVLTGSAELDAAKSAVDDGRVFWILNKPCSREQLLRSLIEAAEHYRLGTPQGA
jgi:DNA-binding NtrC family response regulator